MSDTTLAEPEAPVPARSERIEQKCAQVLEGAREVFLASGFEGASVDDIARTAGISKATLYRLFPDKAALFSAVAAAECARQAAHHPDIDDDGTPLESLLLEMAKATLEFSLSRFGQGIYRISVAESERFPELGRSFYRTGPGRNRARLAPVLAAAAARGEILELDADHAAHVFFAIVKAEIFHKQLFCVAPPPTPDVIDAHARRAVATFLRAYGHRPAAG
jgi:AcrR family transcriptional regulator